MKNVRTPLPFEFPVQFKIIEERRSIILSSLFLKDASFAVTPVQSIDKSTLSYMRDLYDQYFLNSFVKKCYGQLPITISNRMTSAAGKFIYGRSTAASSRDVCEIRMSGDFLFRLEQGPFTLNGLQVMTPQMAFLVVFEHELVHAVEYGLYGKTGHTSRFLYLAGGLFGHTETHHQLPTRRQNAEYSDLRPGEIVSFFYHGCKLSGQIQRIGKTATVFVPDPNGQYADRQGKRYTKYRVPLSLLFR